MTIPFAEDTKRAAKRALLALGVGDHLLDQYSRSQRVRRARSFLESGFVFPQDREAILRDFAAVSLNTQLSIAGIVNIEAVARLVARERRHGAFVECGSWRGGALGYWARSYLRNGGDPQASSIWAFDSFEGMPHMTEHDGDFAARWLYQRPLSEVGSELLR